MFQSFWNVAAAFCAHERGIKNTGVEFHFGHHLASAMDQHPHLLSQLKDDRHQNASDISMYLPPVFMDHHDHLPVCLHIICADIQQHAQEPIRIGHLTESVYDWTNSYRSPHLSGLNPPPLFTPLQVG